MADARYLGIQVKVDQQQQSALLAVRPAEQTQSLLGDTDDAASRLAKTNDEVSHKLALLPDGAVSKPKEV